MHETTKIRLCRAAFVLLCVLPAVGVAAWCAWVRMPGYTRSHEQALAARLGMRARMQRAGNPLPGVWRYENLELSDAENRQPLVRLPLVELTSHSGLVRVRVPATAEVNGARLDAFWQAARQQVRPAEATQAWELDAAQVTVHLPGLATSFVDVAGRIDNDSHRADFKLQWHGPPVDGRAAQPAVLSYRRDWHSAPTAGSLQVETGPAPLPCALAVAFWPQVALLGTRCDFQGSLRAGEVAGHWESQWSGRLKRLDLEQLVAGPFRQTLSGLAQVDLISARVVDGRLDAASGRVSVAGGKIGGALLEAARNELRMRLAEDVVPRAGQVVAFDRLALAFAVSERGLQLRGEAAPGGVVLTDARGSPLVADPAVATQPVARLARVLAPAGGTQVPATRQTTALVAALPLPAAGAPPPTAARGASPARANLKHP